MKLSDYFGLTIEERIIMANNQNSSKPSKEYSLEDYYGIEDACSFLEQLRAYQLSDILGKYKLF